MAYHYTPSAEDAAWRARADVAINHSRILVEIIRRTMEETERLIERISPPLPDCTSPPGVR